ncbi:MAG: serine hydroxymethyltransferase [Patescibacteria group bacterium]
MEYLKKVDPQMNEILEKETERQETTLMMIPSENHTSQAVKEVVGSIFQDKYCEGYPYKRYYQGQEYYNQLEELCQDRVKKAFGVPFVNVQPLSGSPANCAVYFGVLEPGDKMMGLRLDQGGHITHGLDINFSGKFYENIFYNVNEEGQIDYDAMEEMALKEHPKIIIAGITSHPMALDFARFSQIAEKCGAYLMADIAHVSGLILAGVYPNPVPYVHIITTTTHKTLRGPRGALIMVTDKGMTKDPDLPNKINKAVFPGLQGGPHENNIAGIAVAVKEAMSPAFKEYGKQVIKNAAILAERLKEKGATLCSGGTNTHLIMMDLRSFDILGNTAAEALESSGIVVNKNCVPDDSNPPFYPSGLRFGAPGITSRGMKEEEMVIIADCMIRVLSDISRIRKEMRVTFDQEKKLATRKQMIEKSDVVKKVREEVRDLCSKFPLKKEY